MDNVSVYIECLSLYENFMENTITQNYAHFKENELLLLQQNTKQKIIEKVWYEKLMRIPAKMVINF